MKADQIGFSVSPERGRMTAAKRIGEGLSHRSGDGASFAGLASVVELRLPN